MIFLFSRHLKIATIIFFVFCFAGCTSDVHLPCENEGPAGNVCREYRYANGAGVGYAELDYNEQNKIVSNLYDKNSNLIKTIVEHFDNGRTSVIAEQYPDRESVVQSWHYGENDSLSSIYFGVIDSVYKFSFEEGKRVKQEYFVAGGLDRWTALRYYQDDGKLYRKSFYDSTDNLLRYENYEYFSTGQNRVTYYTANHEVLARKVISFSALGLITSSETTNAEGVVTAGENYIYDMAGKLTEQSSFKFDQTLKSVYLYY